MLRHSNDSEPGYTREKSGKGWIYRDEKGRKVTAKKVIERLNALALPPAYTDAWFCKDENGHIQATGLDAKGRKQYRYHPHYRAKAEAAKFDDCLEFGRHLARIRRRVEKDLCRRKLHRDTVLAAVVRLLDTAYFRVGNDEYAKDNNSFGATTLLCRHVRKKDGKVMMRFRGKHGETFEHRITDRRLARIVKLCQDLPGQDLFQYVNGDGVPQPIRSDDVNAYIREAAGEDFTAKDFRTWGASVVAFRRILDLGDDEKLTIKELLEPVAEALRNTPAVSRKSYVHPALVDAVKNRPDKPLGRFSPPRKRPKLSQTESSLIAFLERRGKKATRQLLKAA